jgi:L-threonylcarbamoyladenylate synthase
MCQTGHLRRAVSVLRAGGVIAYPTESVYGLGCDPLDEDAVARILEIKGRPAAAGFILLAGGPEQLRPYISPTPRELERMLAAWPGPVTWVVARARWVPDWITGGRETVAVRVTAERQAAALCRLAGTAIISTSANRSGRPPARTALQARLRLGARLDYVLPGQVGGRPRPTEIRDAASGSVLRAG